MEQNKSKLENNWKQLIQYVTDIFGDNQKLDLQAVLFLIGVNELGQGYRDFTKEEKVNLLHIAICKLLSRYGYYQFLKKDKDGWPHWKTNDDLPSLKVDEQTDLLKESAILYFTDSGINF
ncbi:MAG: hypothetical protein CBD51_006155 [Flavobacteriales bacterium TMED191]|nr:MAG: hypothetical protein CBD51_006155 [Flavobacteriales bacterium TMED191]|tara:strand:+ start:3560 stop:3919 length:360 start_codon:yes stop_codon:yes gene_type:complete